MDLHEYQSKLIMSQFGIVVPNGKVVKKNLISKEISTNDKISISNAVEEIIALNGVVVIKAQVHAGGRGKAGGVKVFKSSLDAKKYAESLLGQQLVTKQTDSAGQYISAIYCESGCKIKKEFYLSMLIDRDNNCISLVVSTEGGMDIEEVADKHPEKIHTITIDSINGYQPFHTRNISYFLSLDSNFKELDLNIKEFDKKLHNIITKLYSMFVKKDLNLLEINPLVLTEENDLIVLDAKFSVEDNGLYRQPEIIEMRDRTQENLMECEAKEYGLSYVKLDGNIGCMVNGAGLAMASMDIIQHYGEFPANFLDIGGAASLSSVSNALRIIMDDKNVKAILVNIFGGIIRCDMIAQAIIGAVNELVSKKILVPFLVVRLSGTNSEEAVELIKNSGLDIISAYDLDDAAQKVVKVIKTKGE